MKNSGLVIAIPNGMKSIEVPLFFLHRKLQINIHLNILQIKKLELRNNWGNKDYME